MRRGKVMGLGGEKRRENGEEERNGREVETTGMETDRLGFSWKEITLPVAGSADGRRSESERD